MTSNDFVFFFASLSFCIAFYIYGFYKGASWAQGKYLKILEKSEENFEGAIKIAEKWRESAERLLQEKYSIDNRKEF